jgi:hypothetical protein
VALRPGAVLDDDVDAAERAERRFDAIEADEDGVRRGQQSAEIAVDAELRGEPAGEAGDAADARTRTSR